MKMDYEAVRTSFATGNPAAGEDLLGLIRIAVQGDNSRNSVRQVRCLLAAMEEGEEGREDRMQALDLADDLSTSGATP